MRSQLLRLLKERVNRKQSNFLFFNCFIMTDDAAPGQSVEEQFVAYVVKLIVNNPEAVVINRTVDEMGVLITLQVDQEDMGRIIGKDGQTAKSLRTMLRVIGSRNEKRVNLKILEPGGEDSTPAAPEAVASAPAEDPLATGFEGMEVDV
jgi:uncharacterized protein